MPSYILLIICVIISVNKFAAKESKLSSFESHPYTVVNKTDKFEIRRYNAAKVAHSSEKGTWFIRVMVMVRVRDRVGIRFMVITPKLYILILTITLIPTLLLYGVYFYCLFF